MAKPLLSFVIPCYRSAHTIGAVVRELNDTLAARADEYDHEIILVNDGSPDDTADALGMAIAHCHCSRSRLMGTPVR